MGVQIYTRERAISKVKRAGPGHVRTCRAVDILKATQQWVAPVRCACRLDALHGGARWRHLASDSDISWAGLFSPSKLPNHLHIKDCCDRDCCDCYVAYCVWMKQY